ncbi:MAG: putative zinc-binding protein [Syntrophomonadaceae bacterium]|nr:putative zinc-binding protein [Syntrophomonadaceae bacterium]MDH7497404.1 putative zinc-binding protein [Syntrophomonadaceae bacterium]
MEKTRVVILPCSGIGKAYGEIGRQAAYEVMEDLRPGQVQTACLGRVMIRDPETLEQLRDAYVVTVDGCAKDCARKNVEAAGIKVDAAVRTIEVFKEHRELKPAGVLELGEPGMQLAHLLAHQLAGKVDCAEQEEG